MTYVFYASVKQPAPFFSGVLLFIVISNEKKESITDYVEDIESFSEKVLM